MSFRSFKILPYAHPMKRNIRLSSHSFQTKEGHYLAAWTDGPDPLFAEIPALPGVHPLSPKESCRKLAPLLKDLTNVSLPPMAWWQAPFFGVLPPADVPPQLTFALESLFLGFYRRQFLKDFNLNPKLCVPVNGLLASDIPDSPASHWSALKIKLPGLDRPLDIIDKLLKHNPLLKIRLDANRTLRPKEVQSLAANIPLQNLDYIEDPYPDLEEGLNQFSEFPLALDKDLAECLQKGKIPHSTVALVVKPTRDLSLSGTLSLIRQEKYKIIVSSAYETPIGLWPLIHLAALTGVPCGLDVQKLFGQTRELSFHPLKNGHITVLPDYQERLSNFFPIFS